MLVYLAPATYDYVIQLAREYGRYPLRLGEYDRDVSPLPPKNNG